ncbi:MAG: uncharacterized protein A8A55_0979 [Amphiamblys sp. WSBS2006]|nr:MAG: uncharacterized protein A8A55_0979 [Amphiamblys sp. WSBS2006]
MSISKSQMKRKKSVLFVVDDSLKLEIEKEICRFSVPTEEVHLKNIFLPEYKEDATRQDDLFCLKGMLCWEMMWEIENRTDVEKILSAKEDLSPFVRYAEENTHKRALLCFLHSFISVFSFEGRKGSVPEYGKKLPYTLRRSFGFCMKKQIGSAVLRGILRTRAITEILLVALRVCSYSIPVRLLALSISVSEHVLVSHLKTLWCELTGSKKHRIASLTIPEWKDMRAIERRSTEMKQNRTRNGRKKAKTGPEGNKADERR